MRGKKTMVAYYEISKSSKMKHSCIREYIKYCRECGINYKTQRLKKLLLKLNNMSVGEHHYKRGILLINNNLKVDNIRSLMSYFVIPDRTTFYLSITLPKYEPFNIKKHMLIAKSDDIHRIPYSLIDVPDADLYRICSLLCDVELGNNLLQN